MNIEVFFHDLSEIFDKGTGGEVHKFLLDSLAVAETEQDKHALVTILNEAAGYFRNTSDYAQAIKMADRAILILQDLKYENTVPYGTTLLNAATAYRAAGDSVKSLELFIASLATLTVLLPEDDYRLAGLYNNISAIHEERQNYTEALEMLKKASAIMETKPDMADDAAIILTNVAMIFFKLDRRAEASAILEKAMSVFQQGIKPNERPAPQYAAALAGMGEAHFRMGEFEKSAAAYEASLKHISSFFGKNRDYAVTCQNCADAWQAAGNLQKMKEFAAKAEGALAALGLGSSE